MPDAKILPLTPLPQPLRVYLAGPMRGRDQHNFPAFHGAAFALRGLGYNVVSPAEHDLELGFDPDKTIAEQDIDFDLRAVLAWDMQQVLAVDAVVTLPGWAHSSGARAEVAVAQAGGVPVMELAEILDFGGAVAA